MVEGAAEKSRLFHGMSMRGIAISDGELRKCVFPRRKPSNLKNM